MEFKMVKLMASIAVVLALIVVMLGAFTRLTDAGLGCPDWPGCYGHMVLPGEKAKRQAAQSNYPQIPIEASKAWTEMGHRYAAGTLGLLILLITGFIFWRRGAGQPFAWQLSLVLILLLVFQAALGMWTVTLKLLPVVVMGHLLGGILIFSCLCYLRMQLSAVLPIPLPRWHFWIGLGAFLVFCQIALGGWVSANYAGIACVGFPQCNNQWLPSLHFAEGFNLFSPVGANYQGGLLDNEMRVTIQFIHRVGAMIVASYVIILATLLLLKTQYKSLKRVALLALLLVLSQFVLGVVNVIYLLPLWVAVAHNGVAAMLMASLLLLHYLTQGRKPDAH